MKLSYWLVVVYFLFNNVILHAKSKDKEAVLEVLSKQSAAWNEGDWQGYMSGYWQHDSLMFIGTSGITYGWQKTMENYQKSYPDKHAMGHLVFEIVSVKRLSGKYYTVVGKWLLQREKGDLKGCFTLLFHKIDGKWCIVADHSS